MRRINKNVVGSRLFGHWYYGINGKEIYRFLMISYKVHNKFGLNPSFSS
jgi:hypothetical protein